MIRNRQNIEREECIKWVVISDYRQFSDDFCVVYDRLTVFNFII